MQEITAVKAVALQKEYNKQKKDLEELKKIKHLPARVIGQKRLIVETLRKTLEG